MYEKRDCTKIIYPYNSIMYVNFSDDIYWTNDIFKQYYANRKVEDIKVNLNSFEKNYLNYVGSAEGIQKLEQDF